MKNFFTEHPDIPWKAGWIIRSGPDDYLPFVTGERYEISSVQESGWTLHLIDAPVPCTTRLLSCGLSLRFGKRSSEKRIDLLSIAPGVLLGEMSTGLSPALVSASVPVSENDGVSWVQNENGLALFLRRDQRFAFVTGKISAERALEHAESSLENNFETLVAERSGFKAGMDLLFSMNPRHNPSVALAAERLESRLRGPQGVFHGLWSTANGFEEEVFSLNELYPLTRAWCLMNPSVALQLAVTAIHLQTSSGGFPSWTTPGGLHSTAAPWPLIAQSFETAWRHSPDRDLLKKTLPALRKYIQWALRYFDPYHDHIPAWQSEQEIFIPDSFERNKSTPELTVFLIKEIDAILHLSSETEGADETAGLLDERNQLNKTLNDLFWSPEQKNFSSVWKDGTSFHSPSAGSFLPLLLPGLDADKSTAVTETLEETRVFPGQETSSGHEKEQVYDATRLPAIHQFMIFEALRQNEAARPMLRVFNHNISEGFASWFDRESAQSFRKESGGEAAEKAEAYELGPVSAALLLAVQDELRRDAERAAASRKIVRWIHRLKINQTDLRIIIFFSILILSVRLLYNLPGENRMDARMAEASLNFKQGRLQEAMRICLRYPHHPQSLLLRANLLLLGENPSQAAELYRQALLQEPGSPSALFGLALALQLDGRPDEAAKRYTDFIDIHGGLFPDIAGKANDFRILSGEGFRSPPRWRTLLSLPMMHEIL